MTDDVNNVNNVNVNVATEEKCGLDMSDHEDPPTAAAAVVADSNGVKANKEDDPDASYVFVGGNDAVPDEHADTADLNGKAELAELAGNVGCNHREIDNEVAISEVVNHEIGDGNGCILEPHADVKGENGAVDLPNGKVAIEPRDGQGRVEENFAGDVQGTLDFQVHVAEPIVCEAELLQSNGSDAKTEEEDIIESMVTPEYHVKISTDVAESEPNQSGNFEVTSIPSAVESESNQSGNDEVIGSANISESESNQPGNVEVTCIMNLAESESNQSGNDEVINSVNLAESESDQSGNVGVTGSPNAAESEQNQSGNDEVPGSANDTEPEQTKSVVEDKVESESKFNLVADMEENQDFPIVTIEGVQSGKVSDLDQGKELFVVTNNLPVNGLQTASELDQNIETATSLVVNEVKLVGAEADDASSSAESVTGFSADHAQDCVAEKDLANGFAYSSPNTHEENGCSEVVETSVSSDAKIGRNEASTASDAENCKGFPAAMVNGAIGDPTNDIPAPIIQLDSEAVDGHITYENRENFPTDHAEESAPQTAFDDCTHASQTKPEGNRLSKVVKPVFHESEAIGSYEINPVAPPSDTALESVVEIGNSCPVNAEINDGMKMETVVENLDVVPTDHAEESDSQTTFDDSTHGSQNTPGGNRLSEVVKQPAFHENGAIGSYEINPVAPPSDTALDIVVEIGNSCPVNNTEIHDGMKMETLVENLDVDNSDLSSHPVSDRVVVIECHPLTNDKVSCSPDNDAKPETDTDSIAAASEEKVSAFSSDEVDIEAEVFGGAANCVGSKHLSAEHPDIEACLGDSVENPVDVKAESEVEKTLMVVPIDDSHASESQVLDGYVVNSQRTLNCIQADIRVQNGGNEFVSIDTDEKTPQEMEVTEDVNKEEASTSSPEGFAVDASDGQNPVVEVVRRPFYYMIRIPRYDDDENLRDQIKYAQNQVDEKTKSRDAIRAEMQRERANCNKYGASVDAAISEEISARDLLKAKRKEIDSVLAVINRGKSASELKKIDATIHGMEHMIQHETLLLKDEKSCILEIKKLKQAREKLSSNLGSQEDVQEAIDQQVQFEERLKILKKEADVLRENALKAEAAIKNAEQKYHEENAKLDAVVAQFRAADDVRQEAYAHLRSLRKRLYDKNKNFYEYKDDAMTASDLASKGNKEGLQCHCINQVEKVMELWNNNDEFRKEYIRCNLRSTVRRLRTLDGRSLGPDEDPPVIPNFVSERMAKNYVVPSISALQEEKIIAPVKIGNKDDKSIAKVGDQKNPTVKSKKPAKHALGNGLTTVSGRPEIEEAGVEEHKLTKEEEDLARKAEELRKEEEAAMLKEQQRLEQMAKKIEAMERRKRNADKAQYRAELRARKEAEQKEKEKEKRARKKEKKKALEEVNGSNGGESAPSSETPTDTRESETIDKAAAVTKRSRKPLHFAKLTKPKSVPLPLRNRGRRRMQTWMWVLLTALIIFALLLMGNGSFSLQRFGF